MNEETPVVLIVSYRRADLLRRCLDSVRTHLPGARILVWDNRSVGTADIRELSAGYPDVEWRFCERNIGFAAAVNALAAEVPGEDLLLLNPDAELTGPLVRCRHALRTPGVAVVSPTVVQPDGAARWDIAHKKITVTRALVDYAGYAPQLRGRRVSALYLAPPSAVEGYLTGCCLFISAAAWEALGPYDERFFLYGEEAAWQARARRDGWELVLVDEPQVRHGAAGTVAGDSAASQRSADLLRAGVAQLLGVKGNAGLGTVFTAGAHVLDRIQRSKRRTKTSTEKPGVLLTSNALPRGGAERQRILLANELTARGYPVTLICLQQFGPLLPELDPAVRLVLTPWWQPFVQPTSERSVLITGITNTEAGFALGWRALHPGQRWLAASHESTPDGPTYGARLAKVIARSDGVIALSPGHWAEINRFQHLGERHFVASNGVSPLPDRGYRPGNPLRFGMLCRIVEFKNPQLLVEALARITDYEWTLDIFGDGPDRAPLQALTPPELADRVRWHGASPGPDHAFAEFDVLCVPSRAGIEAFPLVIVEAMMRGLPVIASAVGSVPDMLDGGHAGTLVHPVSVNAWADALRAVLADPARLGPLAARAHSRANARYTVSAMADAYERAIVNAR